MDYLVTCCSLENLILTQKTRSNHLSDMALRADERFPKLDVVGSNPIARFLPKVL
jgi:hypothetical protein